MLASLAMGAAAGMGGGSLLGIGIGGAFQMLGGYMDYRAAAETAKAYKYQEAIFRKEADIAKEQGMFTATEIRQQANKLIGAAKASYGSAGVLLEGSPLLVLQETARLAEADAMMAEYSGEVQAERMREQAKVSRMNAKGAKDAGKASLWSSFLG